jgi:hypothetical protein
VLKRAVVSVAAQSPAIALSTWLKTGDSGRKKRFGDILEYKLPNGQGARFSSDGNTFIGFIE